MPGPTNDQRLKRLEKWKNRKTQTKETNQSSTISLQFAGAPVPKKQRLRFDLNTKPKVSFAQEVPDFALTTEIKEPIEVDHDATVHFSESSESEFDIQEQSSAKLAIQSEEKVLKPLDHTQIDYEPFKKNLYTPPRELDLTEPEVVLARRARHVSVNGDTLIAPIEQWYQVSLPKPLMDVVAAKNYAEPSGIQSQAIPLVLKGHDVFAVAPTGSGKTAAYVLPMLRHIADQQLPPGSPMALVLVPTRELCLQVFNTVSSFSKGMDLTVALAYGGTNTKNQINAVKRGIHVLVATPGRLIDLLSLNKGRITNCLRTTFVVIDEADRMVDMGFEPQVQKILSQVRPDRQSVMFSATLSPAMERIAGKFLNKPVRIIVGIRSAVAAQIEQIVTIVEPENKFSELLKVLGESQEEESENQTIVFTETQVSADKLVAQLLMREFNCMNLHGGMDQQDRTMALTDFESGNIKILVATSLAARGLDVANVSLVVNYDPPSHLEDYVHRVGRTGRAGSQGTAITFLNKTETRQAADVARALKMSKQPVPEPVAELAQLHYDAIKKGTTKRSSGFGGKGLERIQSAREVRRSVERDVFDRTESVEPEEKPETVRSVSSGESLPLLDQEPQVVAVNRKFQCVLVIDELPQPARLAVLSYANQAKTIDLFGVSLTNRGVYKAQDEQDKLRVIIEGDSQAAVLDAHRWFVERVAEALASNKGGRYTV